MRRRTVLTLRAVLVMLLAGSLFVQAVMVPLMAIDVGEVDAALSYQPIAFLVIAILGIVTSQVVLVCVWRLLTMVRRGTLFSHAAFRFVHVIIGAFVAAAVAMFALAVVFAPGEAVAPGVVLMMCGAVVALLGVALIVFMLRMLLAQAVARDIEATHMQAELDAVI